MKRHKTEERMTQITLEELHERSDKNSLWLCLLIAKAQSALFNPYVYSEARNELFYKTRNMYGKYREQYQQDIKKYFDSFARMALAREGALNKTETENNSDYERITKNLNLFIPLHNAESLFKYVMAILSYTFFTDKLYRDKYAYIFNSEIWDDSIPISYNFFSEIICNVQYSNERGIYDEDKEVAEIFRTNVLNKEEIDRRLQLELQQEIAKNRGKYIENDYVSDGFKKTQENLKVALMRRYEEHKQEIKSRKILFNRIGCPYENTFSEYKRFLRTNVKKMNYRNYFEIDMNDIFNLFLAYPQ